MNYEIPLMGLAIHILVWDKLPEWGNWFNTIIDKLPKPLQTLYRDWKCPYCFGFWIMLALHGYSGVFTFPFIAELADKWGYLSLTIAWFLDALAGATVVLFASISIYAISYPAVKGYFAKQEFKENLKQTEET